MEQANLSGQKVLFISYFFPPIESTGVPGAMRSIKFIRHLNNGTLHLLAPMDELPAEQSALKHISMPVNNETVHRVGKRDIFKAILSIKNLAKSKRYAAPEQASKESTENDTQAQSVFQGHEPNQSVSKAQKLKDFIYDLCYFPDQAGPWVLPAYRKAKAIIKSENIDVIFATGSPWSSLVIGYLASKSTKTPLIVDFRDPWINNPFHVSKGRILDNWAKKLEYKIINHAALVTLNTGALKKEFVERYPSVSASKFMVLPNGFDETDFPDLNSPQPESKNTFTVCHTGFLYGLRDPSTALDAIKLANVQLKAQGKMIKFKQIGEVSLNFNLREKYQDMIDNGSLELCPPIPYEECLNELAKSDWLINIQPETKTQVPSKLYDYLAINRPIINITPNNGALGQLVNQHGLGEIYNFNEANKLSEVLAAQARENYSLTFSGYESRELFNCKRITNDLAEKIVELSS